MLVRRRQVHRMGQEAKGHGATGCGKGRGKGHGATGGGGGGSGCQGSMTSTHNGTEKPESVEIKTLRLLQMHSGVEISASRLIKLIKAATSDASPWHWANNDANVGQLEKGQNEVLKKSEPYTDLLLASSVQNFKKAHKDESIYMHTLSSFCNDLEPFAQHPEESGQ